VAPQAAMRSGSDGRKMLATAPRESVACTCTQSEPEQVDHDAASAACEHPGQISALGRVSRQLYHFLQSSPQLPTTTKQSI